MICIKCGSEAKEVFCDDCFMQQHELFGIDNFSIILCSICGAYYDSRWNEKKDFADIIKSTVSDKINTKHKITNKIISFKTVGNKVYVTVECTGKIKPCKKPKKETKKIIIILKKRQCDICEKRSAGYYEAALQIRGIDVEKLLKKALRLADETNAAVTGIAKDKSGYDMRFMHKKEAGKIIAAMRKGHSIESSFKLVGEKKGKKLYRDFYVVK